ncbi:MAG: thymidylate synthase [Gammaproteobacteria bacterium]|nr:thymidylate synthase [Gammaproteobacteria bacterium]
MTIQYLDLLADILDNGTPRGDRTGTGTTALFGRSMRFDLSEGFPLLTTKKLPLRWIAEELLWMLSGSTDEHVLRDKKVHIWSEWATEEQCAKFGREPGDLGPAYGHLWRNFGASGANIGYYPNGIDQIAEVVRQLRESPNSRRIIITGWDPREATQVALPPCHTLVQFDVDAGKLSCQLYMRSADVFLGVPFNTASYALLTHMFAQVTGLEVGDLIMSFGNVHIYNNHREQVRMQIERDPRPLPELLLDPTVKSIDDFEWRHIEMRGYDPCPTIKAEVSV